MSNWGRKKAAERYKAGGGAIRKIMSYPTVKSYTDAVEAGKVPGVSPSKKLDLSKFPDPRKDPYYDPFEVEKNYPVPDHVDYDYTKGTDRKSGGRVRRKK